MTQPNPLKTKILDPLPTQPNPTHGSTQPMDNSTRGPQQKDKMLVWIRGGPYTWESDEGPGWLRYVLSTLAILCRQCG